MHPKSLVFFCIAHIFFTAPVSSQSRTINHTLLQKYLQRQGYESIVARTSASVTLVQIEDARNRYPTIGVLDGLGRTSFLLPPSTRNVVFVVQKYGVPLVVFENSGFTSMLDSHRQRPIKLPRMALSPQSDKIIRLMSYYPSFNASHLKTDFIFHPDLKMQFGNYRNPVEVQFNIIPEIQILLMDGFLLSASIILPIYNELDEWENNIRPGPTTLNYLSRLKNDYFFYGAAGLFLGDRYGAEVGVKKFIKNGTWIVDGRIGRSGFARMEKGVFWITPWQDFSCSLSAHYFEKHFRIFAAVGVHRFVSQQHGLRMEINRFFDEFLFGFWGTFTEQSYNGGMQISLPLPPRRYKSRGLVRPRVASYLDMMYVGKYTDTSSIRLHANRIMDDVLMRNNPQYLHSKLQRMAAK